MTDRLAAHLRGLGDPRVIRATAPYGLGPSEREFHTTRIQQTARRIIGHIDGDPGIVLITGPSGSGKSTLLGEIERLRACRDLRVPAVCVDRIRFDRRRPVAGLARRIGLHDWLGCLSRAGLADASIFATRAGDLSVGETMRLRLALGFAAHVTEPACGLIFDECCSVLDRATAAGVAASLHRWARATGAPVIAAGAHEDLARLLGPDLIVRVAPGGESSIEQGAGRVRAGLVRIEQGSIEDYTKMAHMHYRGGRPASVARVLRATVVDHGSSRRSGARRVAGVLVVSYPTLNGAWRDLAWPGRYVGRSGESAVIARRLNREVRRISRVVIDPRDRGRGIARRLVRAYLDNPLTPATEAVSAMGRLSPFGRSAGMVAYELPPRPADDRLADMLDAMGLEPWQLLDQHRLGETRASGDGDWLARELNSWARAVRSSVPKPMRDAEDPFAYARLAAARLCAPPVAYAHAV